MRLSLRLPAFLLLVLPLNAPLLAATPEEEAVLRPVQAMFDGMAKRDAAAIQAPLLPGGSMIALHDGKPAPIAFTAFAERIGKPGPKIEEKIYNPTVRIDGDLAVVWAPFDFFLEGKVDHCGTDLFNLVKTDGRWLIASISFNSRKECPAH